MHSRRAHGARAAQCRVPTILHRIVRGNGNYSSCVGSAMIIAAEMLVVAQHLLEMYCARFLCISRRGARVVVRSY